MPKNKLVYIHRDVNGKIFCVNYGNLKKANKARTAKKWKDVADLGYTVEIVKEDITIQEAYEIALNIYQMNQDSIVTNAPKDVAERVKRQIQRRMGRTRKGKVRK